MGCTRCIGRQCRRPWFARRALPPSNTQIPTTSFLSAEASCSIICFPGSTLQLLMTGPAQLCQRSIRTAFLLFLPLTFALHLGWGNREPVINSSDASIDQGSSHPQALQRLIKSFSCCWNNIGRSGSFSSRVYSIKPLYFSWLDGDSLSSCLNRLEHVRLR